MPQDRADYKYMQPVIAGRAGCKRLGESETVCVFVIMLLVLQGLHEGRRVPAGKSVGQFYSQSASLSGCQPT